MGGFYGAVSTARVPANLGPFANVLKNSTDGATGYFADVATVFNTYAGANSTSPTNGPTDVVMYYLYPMNYYYKGEQMRVWPNSYYSLVMSKYDRIEDIYAGGIDSDSKNVQLSTSNYWHNILKRNQQEVHIYVKNLSGVRKDIYVYDTTNATVATNVLVPFVKNTSLPTPSSMTNIEKRDITLWANDNTDVGYHRNSQDNPGFPQEFHFCALHDPVSNQRFLYTVLVPTFGGKGAFSFGTLKPGVGNDSYYQ